MRAQSNLFTSLLHEHSDSFEAFISLALRDSVMPVVIIQYVLGVLIFFSVANIFLFRVLDFSFPLLYDIVS